MGAWHRLSLEGHTMQKFAMTSCPYSATSFEDADERAEALAFARSYRSANMMVLHPRITDDAYGKDRVQLPSFSGDLWVRRA